MTTYYIDPVAGNDSNSGLSPASAWQTSAIFEALNSTQWRAGSSLLIRSGATLYRPLLIPGTRTASDGRVFVGRYGDGPNPVICQYKFMKPTAWVLHAANVWKSDLFDVANFNGNQAIDAQSANVGFIKVDGEIFGAKKFALGAVTSQWDFYSDMATGVLYVYSVANPSTLAAQISVAVGNRLLRAATGVDILGIDLVGCGGHGAGDAFRFGSYTGTIKEVGGGHLLGAPVANTRYGNGFQLGNSSREWTVQADVFDAYDVAFTMQGESSGGTSGFTDCWFSGKGVRCHQLTEVYALNDNVTGWPSGTGFIRTGFRDIEGIDIGRSWSSGVRPDTGNGAGILFYSMDAPVNDIIYENIKVYDPLDALIVSGSSGQDPIRPGMQFLNVAGFLSPGKKIFNLDPETADQWLEWATRYGATGLVSKIAVLSEKTVSNALRVISDNVSSANTTAQLARKDRFQQLNLMSRAISAAYSGSQSPLSGSGAPAFAPLDFRTVYRDTAAALWFIPTGTTDASDWKRQVTLVIQSSAPAVAPSYPGRLLVDQSVGAIYGAKATGAATDWTLLNAWKATPPTGATSFGIQGQEAWDGTYYWKCVAANTWIKFLPTP